MPFSRVGIDPIGRVDVLLAGNSADLRGVSAVGAAKAPLAQVTSGFGTGRWGVGGGLSSAMSAGGMTLFAEAIYWQIGNPPGASLRNAVVYAMSWIRRDTCWVRCIIAKSPDLRRFLTVMRYFTITIELLLVVYLIVTLRQALRRTNVQDGTPTFADAPEVIEQAITRAFGEHALSRGIATEMSMLYFALGGGGPVQHRSSGQAFAIDTDGGLTVTIAMITIIAIETVVVHLFLIRHHPTAAVILSVLSLYSVLWFIGDYRARGRRLVTTHNGQLVIRVGLQCTATSPIANIRLVQVGNMRRAAMDRTLVDASLPSDPNVLVSFTNPVTVRRLLGIRRAASAIALRLRDPQQFVKASQGGLVDDGARELAV